MALPSLTTEQIRDIEILIGAWHTKLTWELLVKTIEAELNIKTTRQTLNTYKGIKSAYLARKHDLRGKPTREFINFTKADITHFERIEKLEAENKILKQKLDQQIAYIRELGRRADTNPLLANLMNEVKSSLRAK